jgi:hypothetical protein
MAGSIRENTTRQKRESGINFMKKETVIYTIGYVLIMMLLFVGFCASASAYICSMGGEVVIPVCPSVVPTPTPTPSPTPTPAPVVNDPAGTITLRQNDEESVTLSAKGIGYFKFTTPVGGCSAYPLKWLVITMINVDLTAGDGQLLVKSTNKKASSAWPTLADYTNLFTTKGYSLGQDWTRAGNGGVFFWRWTIGAPSEALVIKPSYAGHTFNQDDTYYLLLYNQGTRQNQYRVMWQCS